MYLNSQEKQKREAQSGSGFPRWLSSYILILKPFLELCKNIFVWLATKFVCACSVEPHKEGRRVCEQLLYACVQYASEPSTQPSNLKQAPPQPGRRYVVAIDSSISEKLFCFIYSFFGQLTKVLMWSNNLNLFRHQTQDF